MLVGVADTIPYVRDTLRGATRPHRGTWLIWGVLAIVVCLSQRADGASWSLVMAGAQAVLTILVFVLAIRRGEGGVSAGDAIMIAIAGGGVIGWIVADEPIVATACVVAADLIGAAMMVPKTYRDPDSETLVDVRARQPRRRARRRRRRRARPVAAALSGLLLPGQRAIALLIHHRRAVLDAGGTRQKNEHIRRGREQARRSSPGRSSAALRARRPAPCRQGDTALAHRALPWRTSRLLVGRCSKRGLRVRERREGRGRSRPGSRNTSA